MKPELIIGMSYKYMDSQHVNDYDNMTPKGYFFDIETVMEIGILDEKFKKEVDYVFNLLLLAPSKKPLTIKFALDSGGGFDKKKKTQDQLKSLRFSKSAFKVQAKYKWVKENEENLYAKLANRKEL
ncbi:MAG: hypothetical protein ACTSXH_16330 [Promethearchaeota archaeon]